MTIPQQLRQHVLSHRAYPSCHVSIPRHTPRRERCHHVRQVSGMSIDMHAHEEEREDQLQPTPHRTEEEVRGTQHIHVYTNELRPTHGLLPLWGGGNTVTLEDIAHRLIADRIAQVAQSTYDPVIA